MMRLTIQRKVFLAMFLLALALLLILLMRWNLEQSFTRYTATAELARMDWLVNNLETAYAEHGDWEFLRADPAEFRRLQQSLLPVGDARPQRPLPEDRPPPPFGGDRPPPMEDRPPPPQRIDNGEPPRRNPGNRGLPPPRDTLDIGKRLAVLDAAGATLAGHLELVGVTAERPLQFEGRVIGKLVLHAAPSAVDATFLDSQERYLLLSGAAAVVLALLTAWWLTRHLLIPIRDLTEGARQIAQGKFSARIPVRQHDELGELAADFNDMAEKLAQVEESRREWISNTSHELRTPLAVLRAEIEALQDGVRTVNPATLSRLHAQAQHLSKLVDDLRLTRDRDPAAEPIIMETLAPLDVLAETAAAFRSRYAAAGLKIEMPEDNEHIIRVRGDTDRLQQVFTNLLENTLRYTNAGGVLKISASVADNLCILQFDDTPPAPPEDALPHLFERFFRAEPSRSRAHGGSGLGLAICKTIVEAHGGTIRAGVSELGGLHVRIALPLEKN
jgi:two-component system sensor histidine kinase BaeS